MFYYICYPFAALLRLFYNMTDSYGLSLILFTLVVKLVMMPFQMKSKKEYTKNKLHRMLKVETLFHSHMDIIFILV